MLKVSYHFSGCLLQWQWVCPGQKSRIKSHHPYSMTEMIKIFQIRGKCFFGKIGTYTCIQALKCHMQALFDADSQIKVQFPILSLFTLARNKVWIRPIKGSSDSSHFNFEINVGKRRIRLRTTLNLKWRHLQSKWCHSRNSSFNFSVVVCRIRLFPTLNSKIKCLRSGLLKWFN